MRTINSFFGFFLSFLTLFIFPINSLAQTPKDGLEFSVTPIKNSLQNPDIHSYFDINLKQSSSITLKYEIRNMSNKDLKVNVSSVDAYTSIYGDIVYIDKMENKSMDITDDSYKLSPYINLPDKVISLKPKERREIQFSITKPMIDKGNLLGGLKFYTNSNHETNNSSNSNVSFAVNNRIQFIMAIKISVPNSDEKKINIGNSRISKTPTGGKITAEIENLSGLIITGVNGKFIIRDSNEKIIYEGVIKDFEMAPKTKTEYSSNFDNLTLDKGNYFIEMILNTDGKTFKNESSFKITEVIKNTNKNENSKDSLNSNHNIASDKGEVNNNYIILIAFLAFSFLLNLYLISKSKKKKKEFDVTRDLNGDENS